MRATRICRFGLVAGLAAALCSAALTVPASAESGPVPDPSTRLTFYVGLPHDTDGLARAVRSVSTPGSAQYRDYLTLRDVAGIYGATDAAVASLREAAAQHSLTVAADFTRTFARVTGTVRQWERAMGTTVRFEPAQRGSAGADPPSATQPFDTYAFRNAQGLYLPAPGWMRPWVNGFDPDTQVYVPALDIPGAFIPDDKARVRPAHVYLPDPLPWPLNGSERPGKTCQQPILDQRLVFTPHQIAEVYGTSAMRRSGVSGDAARVTIISLGGGFSEQDLRDAAACFGYRAPRIDLDLGDGVPSPIVSFSEETHLDLQTVSAVLRTARSLRLVQAVNDDDSMVDAYSMALRGNAAGTQSPDSISLSYGGCELGDALKYAPLRATLESEFAMAALVGTSVLIASGDTGSSICQRGIPEAFAALARPTVGYPASSPLVTAVGGTRLALNPDNTRRSEVVWNDLRFGEPAAGTGGASQLFTSPWYQRGITGSSWRTVPDVAALAAIAPGWPVVYGGELTTVGGTSGSTPFTAANLALISGSLRQQGDPPIGFANPWLYSLHSATPGTFYDVRTGDNQVGLAIEGVLSNFPACCSATRGYDLASGLGSPHFDRLLAAADAG